MLLDGKSGDGKSLIVRGWQRAGALSTFFAPYKSKPASPEIVTPHHIYAANPKGETQRPWETVTPLAAWLNYKEGTSHFNVDYSVGDEKQLVKSVLEHDSPVLISWEHLHIMPDMIGHLQKNYPITNYSSIPGQWPDVFYLVWVFDLNGGKYTWSSVNQNLLAGDVN